MSQVVNYIKQRLSLREPLQESLAVIADLGSMLSLQKVVDLEEEATKVKSKYDSFKEFERKFPSVSFSIATGVGKTRLMGAAIAYLYMEKGIRNFFVLAPNLTIYEKLIEDFGNPSNPKYVFNGIAEFVHNRPVIITGDNYASLGGLFGEKEIRINVFNISKFNKDASNPRGKDKGNVPRIKRLAEYLGQSYWSYLSNLNDLVMLMDEAHRYHADSSAAAINDLKPVLGLELTATPLDEKGNPFKNIVYEYNLAEALADGRYVKSPAIAYRSDFQTQGKTDEEIEHIKLEDAITLHEDVKTELEVFANNTGNKKVKPFILVVCRDINHAKNTLEYIKSAAFYQGEYAAKVIQIDSSVNDEENARLLESVEQYDNPIEIVIHVNMLAEGWDVTNLYTICPLRKADSVKLIEQTIGRGLRLPFGGERVGVEKIDRLTVIAHDNFKKVIEAAQDPNSILKKFSFVDITDTNKSEPSVAVVVKSKIESLNDVDAAAARNIVDEKSKQQATQVVEARRAIIDALPGMGGITGVTQLDDLNKPEIKIQVIQSIKTKLEQGQQNIFSHEILQEAERQYESVLTNYKTQIIEIPRIDVVQEPVTTWFDDFDLDTSNGFEVRVLKDEIKVQDLISNKIDTLGVKFGAHHRESPENQIIVELLNYPELDYEQCPDLIHKLVRQALGKIEDGLEDKSELHTLIRQSGKIIANKIWIQMKGHFQQSKPGYKELNVLPFTKIEPWSFSALSKDGYKDFREQIQNKDVTKFVYIGFEKSCHSQYKFDSSSEKIFAQILEQDASVIRWLRPAEKQFRLYWANNSRKYLPDFVVERKDAIYIVEIKAANQIDTGEVQDKKNAAMAYCKHATDYNMKHGKLPWQYLIIPHDVVMLNSSFDNLLNRAE